MLWICLLPALFAQESEEEFDFLTGPDAPKEKVGGDFDIYDDEEDWTAEIPAATLSPSEPAAPSKLDWQQHPPLSGKQELQLSSLGSAGWMISLPILVTLPGESWEGEALLVKLSDGDRVLSQTRHDWIAPGDQPGLIFSSHYAPLTEGALRFEVLQLQGEGEPEALFQREVSLQP